MDVLTGPVARLLFGLPFVVFGIRHFLAGSEMAGMIPGWLPGGVFWVYLAGLGLLLAGIAIVIKVQAKLACLLLALLLLAFTLSLHLPGGPTWQMMDSNMALTWLLFHIVMIGAALGFAGIFAREESGAGAARPAAGPPPGGGGPGA